MMTALTLFFFLCLDGAGEGKDPAQVHVDDEPRVAACYF